MCIRDSLLAEGMPEEAAYNIAVAGIGDINDLIRSLDAVSYTHLDVYKRQQIDKKNERIKRLRLTGAFFAYLLNKGL